MFRVLQPHEIGMGLTESLAMTPAASVSGFYIAHPQATYFNVGTHRRRPARRLGRGASARGADDAARAGSSDSWT